MPRVSTTFFAWIITSGLLTKYFKAGDCETGIISLEGFGWVISITKFTIVPSSGLVIVGSGSAVIVPSSGLVIVGSGSAVIVPSSGLVIIVSLSSIGVGETIVSHGGSKFVQSSLVGSESSGGVTIGSKEPFWPPSGVPNLSSVSGAGTKPIGLPNLSSVPGAGGGKTYRAPKSIPSWGVVKVLLAHQVVVKDLLPIRHQEEVGTVLRHQEEVETLLAQEEVEKNYLAIWRR